MTGHFAAYGSGVLFALGLGLSGMTQPGKVTAFLDFAGAWDPSLLFVMIGAIGVYAVGYRLTVNRRKPWFSAAFHLPATRPIDRSLVLGSALFGIGWGIAGYCPGPALTSLVTLRAEPIIFVVSMIVGMSLFAWKERKRSRS